MIGNPTDDWNWMEELNRFMEVPANHPGALTDLGMEHDAYDVLNGLSDGPVVEVELQNAELSSKGFGLIKHIRLLQGEARIEARYSLPESLEGISIDFALSPDYLNLLRHGRALPKPFVNGEARGWSAILVQPVRHAPRNWRTSRRPFGRGPRRFAYSRRRWLGATKSFAIS